MADWGGDYLNHEMMEMVEKVKRRNLRFVNGRAYVPLLGECAAGVWNKIGECTDDSSEHRCTGYGGGHPDLLVWDILEALYSIDEFNVHNVKS